MRHRADSNQEEIVEEMRALGASVQILSQVGKGCPDLLVGWRRENHLFEVKAPKGKLSKSQIKWWDEWAGTVYVIRDRDNVKDLLECL